MVQVKISSNKRAFLTLNFHKLSIMSHTEKDTCSILFFTCTFYMVEVAIGFLSGSTVCWQKLMTYITTYNAVLPRTDWIGLGDFLDIRRKIFR
jgi:hypothetical protein